MIITDLLGPKALPFIDYFGWLNTKEGMEHIRENDALKGSHFCLMGHEYYWVVSIKAQVLLSTHIMSIDDFVRPEEPHPKDFKWSYRRVKGAISRERAYRTAHKAWQNQQPLFEGELKATENCEILSYKVSGMWVDFPINYKWNLNTFLEHNKELGLMYNPNKEI